MIFGAIFDSDRKKRELAQLEKKLAEPTIWNDKERSQELMRTRHLLEQGIETQTRLEQRIGDLDAYFELAQEGEDVEAELMRELKAASAEVDRVESMILLGGENDRLNAIVTIHPGAGGTESQDWAEMLLRMYLRWSEDRGYKTIVNECQPGEEAGLKSATFSVMGEGAYGLLVPEICVHRLVRISPFDAAARRHTSFASVFVSPEIDDKIKIEIRTEDLRIDTYRSSGRGGQHVNVTDSAVRITHLPSRLVAQCQNERSQHRNREMAMKILRSKLYEVELQKKRAETEKLEASKSGIDFGSQIRSYVLHPYQLVKDHRTKTETGDVDRVLDGDLEVFTKAFLLMRAQ